MARPEQITDRSALESAVASERFLLFKHSRVCPISERAFEEYEAFVRDRDDLPTGWIDVIGQRPWSLWVAERTGVRHESPQALLVAGGEVVWHASHQAISRRSLENALAEAE